jgi:hypothetical protein
MRAQLGPIQVAFAVAWQTHRCGCRKSHPCWSSGMLVFVEEPAETVVSADVQMRDLVRVGEWLGEWTQRSGVGDASVGPVRVVVPFVLAEGVEQVGLVPDE